MLWYSGTFAACACVYVVVVQTMYVPFVLCGAGENSIIIVGGANQAWPDQLPLDTREVSTSAGRPAAAATWCAAAHTAGH
jgi:hypothetical protein